MLIRIPLQRGLLLFLFYQFLLPANAQQILTLDKALEIARSNSPNIRTSLFNLENSEQSLKAQKAALKSKFSLSLTPLRYYKNRSFDDFYSLWNTNETTQSYGTFTVSQPFLSTDATISLINKFGWQRNLSEYRNNVETKSFSNNLYLSIDQPLFTYNHTKLNLKVLELNLENAQLNYALAKLDLEKQVTRYFYNVYLAQMDLSVSQDELANTSKSYEITKNKVTAGILDKEELYQAEVNYATAKSTAQNAQVTLDYYKDLLKQYIGMNIPDEITVMTDVNYTPVTIDLNKAIEHGLTARMELRQHQIKVENAQLTLVQTNAASKFSGDLNVSVGIIGENEKLNNIYTTPTNNPSIAVTFNVPIFDWGAKKAKAKAQEATIASQQLSFEEEKKTIMVDIRQAYRNIQNQAGQIEIAARNEKNARMTYEINLERYANGDLTSMDLNLYQNQLSSKKTAYAQALINYKIYLLNMKIQSLYDFERNQEVISDKIIQKK